MSTSGGSSFYSNVQASTKITTTTSGITTDGTKQIQLSSNDSLSPDNIETSHQQSSNYNFPLGHHLSRTINNMLSHQESSNQNPGQLNNDLKIFVY